MATYLNENPELFKTNKFTHVYYFTINRAKNQTRMKSDEVSYERHHINPKSLGGSNFHENLVLLTMKEHFFLHWYLPKMCISNVHKKKMLYCLNLMIHKIELKDLKLCAKRYEEAKLELQLYRVGVPRSPETVAKMSAKLKGKKQTPEAIKARMDGRLRNPTVYTEEIRKTFSEAAIKRGGISEKCRQASIDVRKGRPTSDATKQKLRAAAKTKKKQDRSTYNPANYFVTLPSGETVTVPDLIPFCEEHNLKRYNFRGAAESGNPHKGYLIKRDPLTPPDQTKNPCRKNLNQ